MLFFVCCKETYRASTRAQAIQGNQVSRDFLTRRPETTRQLTLYQA